MQDVKRTLYLTSFFVFMSALPLGIPIFWTPEMIERFFAHTGSYSMQLSYMGITLILVRMAYVKIKQWNTRGVRLVASFNQFVTKYHYPIGWSALILAVIHSLFYLIKLSPKWMDTYSGIIATAAMILVTILGLSLQKKLNRTKARKWHIYISLILIVGVIVHNYYADVHAEEGIYKWFYGGR
ncbi:hypothetical protein ACQCN2_12060 [Brevibacillus ginsengisoli]|uniref:hypothetical protein n=1 Tax=Brevibacillus ginsengisoli TaxID=363854 RepID=UPI003CEF9ECA